MRIRHKWVKVLCVRYKRISAILPLAHVLYGGREINFPKTECQTYFWITRVRVTLKTKEIVFVLFFVFCLQP